MQNKKNGIKIGVAFLVLEILLLSNLTKFLFLTMDYSSLPWTIVHGSIVHGSEKMLFVVL